MYIHFSDKTLELEI